MLKKSTDDTVGFVSVVNGVFTDDWIIIYANDLTWEMKPNAS